MGTRTIPFLFLLIGLAAVPAVASPGERVTGTVQTVYEGDLVAVKIGAAVKDVRLYGADCPEIGQPFSDEAKAFVTEKVLDKEVTVELLTEDDQGKPVVTIELADGVNLNRALVRGGLAWWDREHTPKDRELRRLNAQAIAEGVGLWADPVSLSPWDYRRSHGLPLYTYRLESEAEVTPAQPAEEEKSKSVSAKGDMEYKRNFAVGAGLLRPDGNVDLDAVMRHQPRLVRGDDGAAVGLTANGIGAIAGSLGFRDGDVITAVNGMRITSEAQILELVNRFKNTKRFQVNVLRDGKPVTVPITLP